MEANPERLGSEASFAALCGVSPVERSSGSRQYRRLNRGGDRQGNAALGAAVHWPGVVLRCEGLRAWPSCSLSAQRGCGASDAAWGRVGCPWSTRGRVRGPPLLAGARPERRQGGSPEVQGPRRVRRQSCRGPARCPAERLRPAGR
ncbi:transposase [Streptomyces lydicus]|nr:IS110 family transposase [Streptomyces lydicus]MDC7336179.1 transposase [Streptomyces lydicus]